MIGEPLPPVDGMPAIVIAGGRLEGEFAERAGTAIKALAPMHGGAPLISAILASLRSSPRIGAIVVIGPHDDLSGAVTLPAAAVILEEGQTGPENVQRGLRFLSEKVAPSAERVLVCTSDMPFITAAALESLVEAAPTDADIVYPVVERSAYERAFPGSPNAFARLAGSEYTGGGVLIVRPRAIAANAALIETVFRARKSQVAMARLLGLPFLLRFLMKRLTVAEAEQRATQITGCVCRALVGAPVEVSADVDSLADYDYVLSRFQEPGDHLPKIAV